MLRRVLVALMAAVAWAVAASVSFSSVPASASSSSPAPPAEYFWNVASPNNTELQRNISASVKSIRWGQVALLGQSFGNFPCLGCGPNKTDLHGGIPQRADLAAHLKQVVHDLDNCLGVGRWTPCVDKDWEGYVVLDYEAWRANWGWTNTPYRTASLNHTRTLHPGLNASALATASMVQYNTSAMAFLTATLRTIRAQRPKIKGLGMYDYPLGLYYPFGFGISGCSAHDCPPSDCPRPQCGVGQRNADDAMLPLYREMTALHPSLYLTHPSDWNATDGRHNLEFIQGAIAESFRLASLLGLPRTAVVPYTWYRYHNGGPASLQLLSAADAALEFALPGAGLRPSRFLIYGAESNLPHGAIRPGESAPSLQETMAFFTRHASLLNECRREVGGD